MTLKKLLKSAHFRDQVRSSITDVLMGLYVIFSGEAIVLLTELYSGDYSNLTIQTLKVLFVRSVIRYCLTRFFPKLFPKPAFPSEQITSPSNDTQRISLNFNENKD